MDDRLTDVEDMLVEYVNGNVTAQELIMEIASPEMMEQYESFRVSHGLKKGNEAAAQFITWWFEENGEEPDGEDYTLNGNAVSAFEKVDPKRIYEEWSEDGLRISQLSTSDNAAAITLWRWANPMDDDKQKCALETDIGLSEVGKWWNTIDWLNGYVGGHWHPRNMNKSELKDFIFEACNKAIEK